MANTKALFTTKNYMCLLVRLKQGPHSNVLAHTQSIKVVKNADI